MLDTLRARLTFWYSIILAIFLLLFGLTSYLLFSRAADRRTDADLTELSNSFLVTFQDEINDSDNPSGMQSAAQLSMIEHRVRDSAFFIVDSDGKIAFSSADVPPASSSEASLVTRAVASRGFRRISVQGRASRPEHRNHHPEKTAASAFTPSASARMATRGRS